ncbi:enoyl-CoA hydratase/isomerase family protein [Nocardiopsis sp. CT-R113]|uniref:Enoyl-CoA hydratase/isomerase family protein n=1 Tax=Nocardiopsis codii TaxID=3065942 RepID=A0ABU7K747_9ACTN|nr:enoyl-CoA hydratase/isomerase family protein [Nocardiopsis sp. CT-R113]MEE2037694.1 enoyl-CoA hydratase/isomerase family protein [Nocardiopsis sp. CT-R113]
MSDDLSVSVEGHVGVLEFRRPPNNHFDLTLLRDLADAAAELESARGCRAIVLCSEGRHFCAGVDFGGEGVGPDPDTSLRAIYAEGLRLFSVPVPVVAAVQGAAVGGGLGVACAADFRVAAPSTRFHANFGALGIHQGFGLSASLPRIIGAQGAAEMLYTARRVTGEKALALGLADRLVEDGKVREAAVAYAHEIAANAPLAVRSMRQTLRSGYVDEVRAAMEREVTEQTRLLATSDSEAGIEASLARAAPVFTGK